MARHCTECGFVNAEGANYCQRCGAQWELMADDPAVIAAVDAFETQRGFALNVSHLTMVGRCSACQSEADSPG